MKLFCNTCKDEVNDCDSCNCGNYFKKSKRIFCFKMNHYCSMKCAKDDDNGILDKVVSEDNKWEEDSF